MVDVEHRTLCALGEDILTLGQQAVDFYLCVRERELAHILHAFEPCTFFLCDVIIGIMEVAQDLFVACLQSGILGREVL